MGQEPMTTTQLLAYLQDFVAEGHGELPVVVSDTGDEVLWSVTEIVVLEIDGNRNLVLL